MSMTAEERAEGLCRQRGIYMGHEGPIITALRTHANAALERAGDAMGSREALEAAADEPESNGFRSGLLWAEATIRALREEE